MKKKCPPLRDFFRSPNLIFALGFGSGYSPKAPGTAGTVVAWILFILFAPYLTFAQQGLVVLASVVIGWPICTWAACRLQTKDPSCVVWDEIAAFWLVLWLIPHADQWPMALTAFILFRLLDAIKPGPIGWADRWGEKIDFQQDPHPWSKAGWGVMLDDLVAAVITLIILWLVFLGLRPYLHF